MFKIGDRVRITESWDWMDYPLERAYDDGEALNVILVDNEDLRVLVEVTDFDEFDDPYTDECWVNFAYVIKVAPRVSIDLTEHDLKYAAIVKKIKTMQAIRKGKGYAF